ncbi:amidase [Solirubrobacter pauli]|uniref:Amidase n=1 Tax=Solirubrobacter pauli TaxID=166793 RepID=A0A660LE71_9ACTN|nr:amidase family protein [Solirubrobacter pauli]RKQ92103.1 amidase [Solirubrobacter pauli]
MRFTSLACAVVGLLLLAAPARAADPALDLERLTVSEAAGKMAAGQLTSVQLTRAYIDRIAAVNARGPGLNAVRLVNPRALQDASLLDLERATGKVRGPLHGVPVLVKDNLDVAGLPTTAGSVALEHSVPDRDSTVVAKLRAAGAVILGKTNLSEFAYFMSTTAPSGYSSLGGQVLNPYDIDANPSGSSSGSGSAAAAGLATLTIGTETSGSIVSPSAAQGIVGLRPTIGLVSRAGILPISSTQDTAGPMTRTVADAAAELQAIAGPDPEDPVTAGAPATDYLAGLKTDALAGKRIGVISNANAQYQAAVAAVQALGATTVQITAPSSAAPYDVLTAEFKRDLNAYLGRLPASAPRKSLADIIAFNTAHADEALKFGQTLLTDSQDVDLSDPARNAAYVSARDSQRAAARAAIDTALSANALDAILTPSGSMTGIGARAGYPQIVVPAGYNPANRLPVGVAFNGGAFSEAKLLAFAYAYEQATKLRKPPSEINPAAWRCSAGAPRSCPPGKEIATGVTLDFPLETATVADLQQRLTAGTLSATQLTKAYLQRIALTNTEGPSINAVRLINPKALEEAAKADAERAAGTVRGPLHGIPVLVKDNLDVAGLPTTAGSVALENSVPDKDSPVVARLRAAGAILLGKLNLSEFANFLTSGMPSGYSSLGGQVLNPYNADITPSGSSSGSGAAAAAGLAAITIGTETSGSIVSPSAAQGIVGLRPTIGLVSRTGILPISATQDTAGPMTRTVADAAAELGAIAGKDEEDPATDAAPATVPDYLAALKPDALAGRRIGVVTSTNAQYLAAITAVQALGATTVSITAPSATAPFDILTPEFKRDLNAYLARLPQSAPMKSLKDIIDFNTAHADDALKYGQTQLTASQATDLTDPAQNAAYVAARDSQRAAARAAIDTALTANRLDAIMTPSGSLTGLGARAGYPQLVVPAGYAAGTRDPVGIAFNGGAFSEAQLLAFGYAYEQATKLRKPPSETNPSLWRCVPGNAYLVTTRACAPSRPANADVIAGTVGGTVPATLSLSLDGPATFPPFVPGVADTYTASTSANVVSTAGEATLTTSDPGHLANGAFRLVQPLQVQLTPAAFAGPVSNAKVAITFRQPIGAQEPLRTGTYARTLTFTLSTTTP